MLHSKIAGAALCVGVLIVAGCSSNKPSKADLTSAIDNYYSANPQCVFSSPVLLPAKVENSDQQQLDQYNALAQAGLLTKTEMTAKQPEKTSKRHTRRSRHEAKTPEAPPTTTFQLSDNGRFSWTEDQTKPGFGNFCYGHRQAKSIDSVAATKSNGTTTAIASYHYDLTGVPSWAKSTEVQSAFTEVQQALAGPHVAKGNFVKDPTGWKLQPESASGAQDQNQGSNPSSSY